MQKKAYHLGRFLMADSDVVLRSTARGTPISLLDNTYTWTAQHPTLYEQGWRVPTFEELWLIGELALLGVGGLHNVDDPYEASLGCRGYWSDTQPEGDTYRWRLMTIQLDTGDDGGRKLDYHESPLIGQHGPNYNRLRLVKEIEGA